MLKIAKCSKLCKLTKFKTYIYKRPKHVIDSIEDNRRVFNHFALSDFYGDENCTII